jgi:Fic family protein
MIQPFTPNKLPITLDISKFAHKIGQANRALAKYDGYLQSIPNPYLMLSPLFTDEALQSSKIEGTQATIEEVLEYQSNPDESDNYRNINEVLNYMKTIYRGVDLVKTLPISTRLLNELHPILLNNSRGGSKNLGQFRHHQVHIGKPGSTVETATYIPPQPQDISDLIQNWETYIHNYEEVDELVKLAIIHAQFEMIHPYEDGNGRLGRILFPLYLFEKHIISSPNFFLSGYLEANREEYYDRLKNISKHNEWENWIVYFLDAVIFQSNKNIKKVEDIKVLYENTKEKIFDATNSKFNVKILDYIFSNPIFSTVKFRNDTKIARATTSKLLTSLVEAKIIRVLRKGSGRTESIYEFQPLMKIIS